MTDRIDDLRKLELVHLWVNIIQSTILAGILTWLAVSTKPADVLARMEQMQVERIRHAEAAVMAADNATEWAEDIAKEIKLIKAKHPHIKAK